MTDWKKKDYPAGTPVNVQDIHGKSLGVGILLTDYHEEEYSEDEGLELPMEPDALAEALVGLEIDMPKIQLADGGIILGCECWWIPVEECENG